MSKNFCSSNLLTMFFFIALRHKSDVGVLPRHICAQWKAYKQLHIHFNATEFDKKNYLSMFENCHSQTQGKCNNRKLS